jgi:hypothetical protein
MRNFLIPRPSLSRIASYAELTLSTYEATETLVKRLQKLGEYSTPPPGYQEFNHWLGITTDDDEHPKGMTAKGDIANLSVALQEWN